MSCHSYLEVWVSTPASTIVPRTGIPGIATFSPFQERCFAVVAAVDTRTAPFHSVHASAFFRFVFALAREIALIPNRRHRRWARATWPTTGVTREYTDAAERAAGNHFRVCFATASFRSIKTLKQRRRSSTKNVCHGWTPTAKMRERRCLM